MNDQMHSGMAEATRLTRQGRLEEATAAIQRALGGTVFSASSPGGSGGADGPIDVDSWIVRETSRSGGRDQRGNAYDPRPNPSYPRRAASARDDGGEPCLRQRPGGSEFR
jgi:hypothetical protein